MAEASKFLLLAQVGLLALLALFGVYQAAPLENACQFPQNAVECQVPQQSAPPQGATLRNYDRESEDSRVRRHYANMRRYQTKEYIERMEAKFTTFERANLTIREAFKVLENYVDASDPDVDLPNVVHNFMAAEAARRMGKPDWMQLTALLHDIGKLMFAIGGEEKDGMSGRADGMQWALGGDTWVQDSPIPSSAVYPEYSILNADHVALNGTEKNPPKLGIRNMRFPWGHDEYAYRWLKHQKNGCKLPEIALLIIRVHSCYPLHRARAYDHLLADGDEEILKQVIDFNQFDLYSKADETIQDLEKYWPYYESLIDKYFDGGSKTPLHF